MFNTSMTGYLEVLTDPSYAGQAVVMTYPLIGNYGICYEDMESDRPWPDGYIVRELSRMPSNFRSEDTIQNFLKKYNIPGIAGVDTRALTKILREKGTMNGMVTTNENYSLEEILPQLKAYTTGKVVEKVTCREKYVLPGEGPKVALLDLGAKRNIARSLNERGCEVTVYPADTTARGDHRLQTGWHHAFQWPWRSEGMYRSDPMRSRSFMTQKSPSLPSVSAISSWPWLPVQIPIR